ncbi:ketopantoate reductase PanE/ApbA family protein [Bordetella bronchiseptica MBORD675]|uniref:ketopantoate reductase family protein n=1 Tax=Bordetella bronchiseptica TaxID=518 RepID=UPI0004A027D7|nr:2-dehydropantoate 2-reductase [Bordetella bronchiseptica]KDC91831.1 ketopantoate reductase PanE/ApbA family protein [Bordetella bronchiseptica MBORD675]
MRVAIFGAGSIGGYVGGKLAAAGTDVLLVDAWPEHVVAMRRAGLRLRDPHGEATHRVRCLHLGELHEVPSAGIDLAVLCVKSYETAWMTYLLREYLSPAGIVLSMQNGMNEAVIASVVGVERVLGCTLTRLGTELSEPGVIYRWLEPPDAEYPVFRVGELAGLITPRVLQVVELLSTVDKAVPTRNIAGERWSKLAQNAMVSGIAPLTHQDMDQMFSSPCILPVMVALVRESIRVGEALGYALEKICGIEPQVWMDDAASGPGGALYGGLASWMVNMGAGGQPSTLHDIRRGRRTEIEAINGLISMQAEQIGLAAPMHKLLCSLVLQRDAHGAGDMPLPESEFAQRLWAAVGR